jgi:tRNA G10  N-methylase Trm11
MGRGEPTMSLAKDVAAMREQLKRGVMIVQAPQLYPTPVHLAQRMVEMADIVPGQRVLEPSAGTGRLLEQLPEGCDVLAIEINATLCSNLRSRFSQFGVLQGDFLNLGAYALGGEFDAVVMNPPFVNGEDIRHIKHAVSLTKPGGVVVALCAGGPRQERELKDLCEFWQRLPEGTFKETGTMVNTVLMVIRG